MPTIKPFSFRLVPEQEAAQARLISPKTPFTLNTGLASNVKPITAMAP